MPWPKRWLRRDLLAVPDADTENAAVMTTVRVRIGRRNLQTLRNAYEIKAKTFQVVATSNSTLPFPVSAKREAANLFLRPNSACPFNSTNALHRC